VRGIPIALVLMVAVPAAASTLEFDGQFVQGGLIRGQTEAGAAVLFDDRQIRVSPNGIFLIGFSRDAPATATLVVRSPGGERRSRTLEIARRTYEIQKIDGLPSAMVSPPPDTLARIKRENALISQVRSRDTPETLFESGWIWPARGPISGVYGSQRILNGEPRQPHYGVDISAPVGSPVNAPAAGIVALAAENMYLSGGTLILDHGHGLTSAFLHLRKILVREGDTVRQGDLIAEVGATGRVTAAHLDWRINLFGARIDPALLVGSPEE
jgi:murein DD-endopeptidase MepM/ murein hydrolase activator NlpD